MQDITLNVMLNFHVAPSTRCNALYHEKYKRKLNVFLR